MIVLGIHDGHGSSVALIADGKIIKVIEEERLTRIKKDTGFPINAINSLKKDHPEMMNNLNKVAIGTVNNTIILHATKKYPLYGIKDFLIEEERFWIPTLIEGKNIDYLDVMSEYVDFSKSHYPLDQLKDPHDQNKLQKIRKDFTANILSISSDKISFVDHHLCHAYHAYYSSPIREDCIIFTMDGIGDGINCSVNQISISGQIEPLYRTGECNIGRMYQYVTLLLGMKPADHEYKVMGLAAYAKEHYIKDPLMVFEDTYYVDGLEIKIDKPINNLYQYFSARLKGFRFDAIAGALQRYVENLLVEWVSNWVGHLNRYNIVFSGGVALNIKAMKKISELDEVKNIFISPGGGDESISIGAAQYILIQGNKNHDSLVPLSSPYISLGYEESDVQEFINDSFILDNFHSKSNFNPIDIAILLTKGEIIALIYGAMEFGPRALGHRSLIADPRDIRIIRTINESIKNRDFWMPFTPSIIKEFSNKYLINPKKLASPYMTMAFDSTEQAQHDIPAAIHPYDFTLRPQIVSKNMSPWYYSIIKEFSKITNVGAVLNTSLNIHGKPIVHKPIDVVNEVLKHELVELKYLVINDMLFEKK